MKPRGPSDQPLAEILGTGTNMHDDSDILHVGSPQLNTFYEVTRPQWSNEIRRHIPAT